MPGRKEHKGAEMIEPTIAFMNSFFGSLICLNLEIDWRGSLVLFFKLIIIADEPNNPVSNGRRGSFTGKLSAAYPKRPARRKVDSAVNTDFSLNIKYNDKKINMNGSKAFVKSKIRGIE